MTTLARGVNFEKIRQKHDHAGSWCEYGFQFLEAEAEGA